MGVIRRPHQVYGMVHTLRIDLNNFSQRASCIKTSFHCFISHLSENGELLFFKFSAALSISLSVIMKSKGRECWRWRSFSRSSLHVFFVELRWEVYLNEDCANIAANFFPEIDGTSSPFFSVIHRFEGLPEKFRIWIKLGNLGFVRIIVELSNFLYCVRVTWYCSCMVVSKGSRCFLFVSFLNSCLFKRHS